MVMRWQRNERATIVVATLRPTPAGAAGRGFRGSSRSMSSRSIRMAASPRAAAADRPRTPSRMCMRSRSKARSTLPGDRERPVQIITASATRAALRRHTILGALVAQVVYYFTAAALLVPAPQGRLHRCRREISANVFAAMWRCGWACRSSGWWLPPTSNDILVRTLKDRQHEVRDVTATGRPRWTPGLVNFERLLFDAYGRTRPRCAP